MIAKISNKMTIKELFKKMDEMRKMGFECYVKGTGSGDVKIMIELPIEK